MRIDGLLGGYPVRFLEQIVRLSKCLKLKRERVTTLRELNSLGERKKSFGEYITEDFQKRYAATVLELSQLNRDLNEHLENIREYTQQVSCNSKT
jgi:predicted  nucleic acid-binding Zn-ribbon protein